MWGSVFDRCIHKGIDTGSWNWISVLKKSETTFIMSVMSNGLQVTLSKSCDQFQSFSVIDLHSLLPSHIYEYFDLIIMTTSLKSLIKFLYMFQLSFTFVDKTWHMIVQLYDLFKIGEKWAGG